MTEPANTNNDPKSLAMPREFVFQNGLRIVTMSTPTLDTARMGLVVNSGSRDDPTGEEGTVKPPCIGPISELVFGINGQSLEAHVAQRNGTLNSVPVG